MIPSGPNRLRKYLRRQRLRRLTPRNRSTASPHRPSRKSQVGEKLPNPLKLRPGEEAWYFNREGRLLEEDSESVLFKCASRTERRARRKFKAWAKQNLV